MIRLTQKFDQIRLTPKSISVSPAEITKANKDINPKIKRAIQACARRVKAFHLEEKKRIPKSWTTLKKGVRLGQRYQPIDSVGIYVPGGRFSYPSTVLMTAIPAQLAGVKRIALVSPPRRLTDEILVAAKLSGVTEIYRVGGPASIAAMALGTKKIPKVDFIVGPGNAWVTEAKRQLFGTVGIDLLAGPSELVVLADSSASVNFVVADMLAQAEHDPDAKSYLITISKELAKHVRNTIPKTFLKQCDIQFFETMGKAIQEVNRIAGEHLELMVRNPGVILKNINNAGTIFLNPWSPTAMGDYWAGPSHVLPTGQSARFASGLSVMTFMKRSSIVGISSKAYRQGWKDAHELALSEGLTNHAASIKVRMGGE